MRYAQADGSPVAGYEPITSVQKTEVVHNDVCCRAGCDGPEFAVLLEACADRTEAQTDVTYNPFLDVDITDAVITVLQGPHCIAVVTIDVSYLISTGEPVC